MVKSLAHYPASATLLPLASKSSVLLPPIKSGHEGVPHDIKYNEELRTPTFAAVMSRILRRLRFSHLTLSTVFRLFPNEALRTQQVFLPRAYTKHCFEELKRTFRGVRIARLHRKTFARRESVRHPTPSRFLYSARRIDVPVVKCRIGELGFFGR